MSKIPDKYILPGWTINARYGAMSMLPKVTNEIERKDALIPLMARNLRASAHKLLTLGSKSVKHYEVTMIHFKEALQNLNDLQIGESMETSSTYVIPNLVTASSQITEFVI